MLITSTTVLNKLKFTTNGGDRQNGAWSGQPFIPKDIPNVEYNNPNQTFQTMEGLPPEPAALGGIDFFLRGGGLALPAAEEDVSRLTKLLFDTRSPNGFEFIAKQNVLSRQSVKTEASFGGGYGFGTINQGLYLPASTLLQTGLAPIAPGSINLFGVNPITDNIPLRITDGRTIGTSSGGINSYFGAVNAQNIGSGGEEQNRLVLLQNAVSTGVGEKTGRGRIQLGGRKNRFITRYGGGPNSIGGTVGRTTIPFTDQRTGQNNPLVKLSGFYGTDGLASNQAQLNGVNFDSFLGAPLIGNATNTIDYIPSKGNYAAFIRPSINSNGYDVNDASNPGASLAYINGNSLGITNRFSSGDFENISWIGQDNLVIDNDFDKVTKFRNYLGPDNYSALNSYSPTIEQGVDGGADTIGQVIRGNLFKSSVSNKFVEIFPDQASSIMGVLGTGIAAFLPTELEEIVGSNEYFFQPDGFKNPQTFNANVYSSPLTSDLANIKKGNTFVQTQTQLYQNSLSSQGNNTGIKNPLDFRKKTSAGDFENNTQMKAALGSSKILSLSPNYQKHRQSKRINLGDPGQNAGELIGKTNQVTKNVLNYGLNADTYVALDKLTATPIYQGTQVDDKKATQDSVAFNIAVMNFDTPSQNTYIHFRAFINEFNDNYTAKWDPVQYVGRGEELYNYKGFGREISMGWTVYAQSKAELIPMYKKLNYLASSLAPDYSSGGYMRGNIVRLTMGGYLYDQPGIITGLSYGIPEESPWEIAINEDGGEDKSVKQMPHMIKVSGFTFIPIQKFIPEIQQNKFDPLGNITSYGEQEYIALANSSGNTNYNTLYKSYNRDGSTPV